MKMKHLCTFLPVMMISMVLCSCVKFSNELTKEEINSLVRSNLELLNKAVDNTKSLDSYVSFISTTQKHKIDDTKEQNKQYLSIKGLYQSGIKSGDYIYERLENDIFLSVLKLNGLISIFIDDEKKYIDFDCGGSGFGPSTSYSGFYYSIDGKPSGLSFYENDDLESDGNGWCYEQKKGDNKYYTEKIQDNWYYYTASF